jgi:sigma-E factor negative regulatory protein RseA
MHDDFNQKISVFLDNELDPSEALKILQKMHEQPQLLNKLNRYEAIAHVLKSNNFLLPTSDFSAKVSKQIQQEPFYLLPRSPSLASLKPFKRRHKVLTAAASLAVIAIVFTASLNRPDTPVKSASTFQLAQQKTQALPANPVNYQYRSGQYPFNARIYDYLQAHNSSVYTQGDTNVRLFAKASASSQE